MPFSALSPDGPVSLLGADATTVENMRKRNREEGCFTAKCCGAEMVIRTAAGKLPHFVHKTVPAGCDGERSETPEHRRLKALIAEEAASTYEWEVETEAAGRDADDSVLWRADVLARGSKASVAFEVQLSGADFEDMSRRQERYWASRVRGLWFVRTKKGFPASKELPVFPVESDRSGDWVLLNTRWDPPEIWMHANGGESLELKEFVRAALDGQLKWAPFENAPDTLLHAHIDYDHLNPCPGCGRMVVAHRCVRAQIAGQEHYPQYMFASGREWRRQSKWYMPLVKAVWSAVRNDVDKTMRSIHETCCTCSTPLEKMTAGVMCKRGSLSAKVRLGDLPKPKFQTVERDWLRRWAVLDT